MIWVAKNLYFFNCLLDGAHTTQCATASIITLFLIPFVTAFFDKMMQKKQKGIYSPEGWAHYKVTGEAAPEE